MFQGSISTDYAAVNGEELQIFFDGDVAPLYLGVGGCSANQMLQPDNMGLGVAAPSGNYFSAISLQQGNQGDLIQVLVAKGLVAGQQSVYMAPTFASFSITGQATPVEVGSTIASGNHTFIWTTTNSANVKANSISIVDTTASVTLATGLANTGSTVVSFASSISRTTPGTQTWTINGLDILNNGFSTTFSVAWQYRVYAGNNVNAELTAPMILALTDSNALQSSFAGTYSYSNTIAYKYFCYPDPLGSVSAFVDANTGFPVSMATVADDPAYSNTANGWSYALVSVTSSLGVTVNYRVYRTQYQFSGTFAMRVS
jgi:hypothetical protein